MTNKLPIVTLTDLLARLERLRKETSGTHPSFPEMAIAFDADGTLWSGDVGIDAFSALLRDSEVRPAAGPMLRLEARASGLPVMEDPNEQARILFRAFHDGTLDEDRAVAMMAWGFAGRTVAEMGNYARRIVQELDMPARLCREVAAVVVWARERDIRTLVVSASPIAVVEAALRAVRLPIDLTIAMSPAVAGDVLEPALLAPTPYRDGKPAAIVNAVGKLMLLAAIGDGAADLPMLAKARIPVTVRPSAALLEAPDHPARLVELCVV